MASKFKVVPPQNRLIGDMPKIGIRPTIDGRLGGVRESLETQCMNMAHGVAELISKNLRHYNGMPVECVIADSTIGGVAEAAACAEKFRKAGVEREPARHTRLGARGDGSCRGRPGPLSGLQRIRAQGRDRAAEIGRAHV